MCNTFEELKTALNIKTIRCSWNDEFPRFMLETTYNGCDIDSDVRKLSCLLYDNNMSVKITRNGLRKLGVAAELCNLITAYFVCDETYIELFFYPKMATNEWLAVFKQHLTRRQFFNFVKSYKTLKAYNCFSNSSSYYQLIAPDLPPDTSVNVVKLNDEYILLQYLNDVFSPKYKVVKPGFKFKAFDASLSYKDGFFNSIELMFDNKVFKGDSIRHLYDGTVKQKSSITVDIKDDNGFNVRYELLPEMATLDKYVENEEGNYTFDSQIVIEKFRRNAYARIILDKNYKGKRIIVLSNGMVWYPDEEKFVSIRSIKGLENLDFEVFEMSNRENGVFLKLDENSIECVPIVEFEASFKLRL